MPPLPSLSSHEGKERGVTGHIAKEIAYA